VTAVLSSPQGAVAGNTITNVRRLSHTGITQSNQPVFTVTEPSLALVKASSPPTSNTVSAGNRITYTVNITNAASLTTSTAFDVAFTDTLPFGLRNTPPRSRVSHSTACQSCSPITAPTMIRRRAS